MNQSKINLIQQAMNNVSGVYKITIGDGFYIGASDLIINRYGSHISLLKSNKHYNKLMQAAYNKFGHESMSMEIIEQTANMDEREKHYIKLLNPTFNIRRSTSIPNCRIRNIRLKNREKIKADYSKLILKGCAVTDALDEISLKYHICISTVRNYLKK